MVYYALFLEPFKVKRGSIMDNAQTNCRYCGNKILLTDPFCLQCGAPNEPEPKPWFISIGNRLKAAFSAKTESVWADRLAALMPFQFVVSAIVLYLSIKPLVILTAIISIATITSCLVYYPGWYKIVPEKRKAYGLVHFIVTLAQIFIYLS